MGVSQIRGTLFRGPYNKDYIILGSILGSPYFGKLPHDFQGLGFRVRAPHGMFYHRTPAEKAARVERVRERNSRRLKANPESLQQAADGSTIITHYSSSYLTHYSSLHFLFHYPDIAPISAGEALHSTDSSSSFSPLAQRMRICC